HGVRIIAAAGNDGQPPVSGSAQTPVARWPAAFSCVLGVGAMESNGKRAWYSNQADKPSSDGMMVFGGKMNHWQNNKEIKNLSDDQGEGMLGIYLGDFPDGNP